LASEATVGPPLLAAGAATGTISAGALRGLPGHTGWATGAGWTGAGGGGGA
jgi:hypothetical protein